MSQDFSQLKEQQQVLTELSELKIIDEQVRPADTQSQPDRRKKYIPVGLLLLVLVIGVFYFFSAKNVQAPSVDSSGDRDFSLTDSDSLPEQGMSVEFDTDYFTAYIPVHWQREASEEIENPKVYTFFSEKAQSSQETGDLYPGFAQFSIEVDPTNIFPLDFYQEYYGSGSPVMVANGQGIQWSGYEGIGGSVFTVTTIINNKDGTSFNIYFYTQDQEYQDVFLNEYNTFLNSFVIK